MLTLEENRLNSIVLIWITKLNFLPIEVYIQDGKPRKLSGFSLGSTRNSAVKNEEKRTRTGLEKGRKGVGFNGDIRVGQQSVPWRLWTFRCFFAIYSFHGFYVTVRLLQCFVLKDMIRIEHFPIHVYWVLFFYTFHSWAYHGFVLWPGISVEIFNQICASIVDGKRKWTERNKQELLAVHFGKLVYFTDAVLILVLAWDSSRLQLFYSGLPSVLQSRFTFCLCLLFEGICTTYFCSMGFFFVLSHTLFFEMTNCRLRETRGLVQGSFTAQGVTNRSASRACKEVRELQLLIQLFNQSNSMMIFTFKVMCIALSIIGGFFAIRYIHRDPMMGLLCIVITMDAMTFFGLFYEKAFMIPDNIKLLTDQILVFSQRVGERRKRLELSRIISSIPKVGIKVGTFHTMERFSTLIFLHYVVCQLGSTLVAFKSNN